VQKSDIIEVISSLGHFSHFCRSASGAGESDLTLEYANEVQANSNTSCFWVTLLLKISTSRFSLVCVNEYLTGSSDKDKNCKYLHLPVFTEWFNLT